MENGARSHDIQRRKHPEIFNWENGRWVAEGEGGLRSFINTGVFLN